MLARRKKYGRCKRCAMITQSSVPLLTRTEKSVTATGSVPLGLYRLENSKAHARRCIIDVGTTSALPCSPLSASSSSFALPRHDGAVADVVPLQIDPLCYEGIKECSRVTLQPSPALEHFPRSIPVRRLRPLRHVRTRRLLIYFPPCRSLLPTVRMFGSRPVPTIHDQTFALEESRVGYDSRADIGPCESI